MCRKKILKYILRNSDYSQTYLLKILKVLVVAVAVVLAAATVWAQSVTATPRWSSQTIRA